MAATAARPRAASAEATERRCLGPVVPGEDHPPSLDPARVQTRLSDEIQGHSATLTLRKQLVAFLVAIQKPDEFQILGSVLKYWGKIQKVSGT